MSSVKKVHLNGSTILSLNDRFTIMQKQTGEPAPQRSRSRSRSQARSRSRSRSRPRMAPAQVAVAPRIRERNRNFLAQLDQKHKIRLAMKLKRVCRTIY